MKKPEEKILQFGTGNFLRAFIDDFLQRMNDGGLYDGGAAIVSPTDSKTVETLTAQDCRYHLLLRGMENGQPVESLREIRCVTRAINPYRDFDAFLSLAAQPALRFIVSNTTEAGIVFDPTARFDDRPPAAFPAKLTRFLYERFIRGLPGFVLLPCELIDENGTKLAECVQRTAALWKLPAAFSEWLREENDFCNTLVDRIVSGRPKDGAALSLAPEDALLDAAEPFCLWAIAGNSENELPLQKAGINAVWTKDVSPYKKIKVRILNGLHTSMVFPGLLAGLETVDECMRDPELAPFLEKTLRDSILPALKGGKAAEDFADAVRARFSNPYLHHRLASISLNSFSKFRVRVLPTVTDLMNGGAAPPKTAALSLACLVARYRADPPTDEAAATEAIRTHGAAALLRGTALTEKQQKELLAVAEEADRRLARDGIREALQWSIS